MSQACLAEVPQLLSVWLGLMKQDSIPEVLRLRCALA